MNTAYYMVNVAISGFGREVSRVEHIKFKSLYAARYMAKQYYECADVQSVEVIDQTTGEVMYCHDTNGEYDAEG